MTDLSDLIARVEAAGEGEQRDLFTMAYGELNGGMLFAHAGTPEFQPTFAKWDRFRVLLDAEAFVDAAMMLKEADSWLELKGPRRYLHIPTSSPNYWSAYLTSWNHERDSMGWGGGPALAILSAILKARSQP